LSPHRYASGTGITRPRLKTPRAAAWAGIAFALLYGSAIVLIRISVPENISADGEWLAQHVNTVRIGLTLIPFAGIAFLWFMGVIRDRLGSLEDQFFSTVFFGSGILLIAMIFVSAALAGGLLTAYSADAELLLETGTYAIHRAAIYQITNIYGIKMAGVFMISLATIWLRTQIMPRWIVMATYGLALILIIVIAFNVWITLLFPTWVFLVSVYILLAMRQSKEDMPTVSGGTNS
jgi:hypothetical protein